VGAVLLSIGVDILRPWPMKLLVDSVLGGQAVPEPVADVLALLPGPGGASGLLLWICVGNVLIFLFGTLLSVASTVATVELGQRTTFSLGADLFLHLQRLSLLFNNRRPVGDSISRVSGDVYCAQTLFAGVLLPLFKAGIALCAMFLIMWRLEPTMTLAALGVTPFLALAIKVFGSPLKARTRERRTLEGRMMALVQQTLSAIPAVQAFTREEFEHERFRRYADETVAAYRRSTLADMKFKFFVGLATAAGTAGIMWLGARLVLEGRMTVGTILVFLSYLGALYEPLNAVTFTTSTWQSASAGAERVLEVLDTPREIADAPGAKEVRLAGRVRFDGVVFGYEPGVPVLREVSLEAHPGESVAIVGPTGGGKTTLVNLLLRFHDPWSGAVSVDGLDVRGIALSSLRRQVAVVLQEPFLFPITVAENIAYGKPGARQEEIVVAAVAARADEFIRRLPQGYDTVLGERGATLSGGERQRLSLARAFLKDAPILVLDEPTSALDAGTESLVLEALGRLMEGRTTFLIAHRLSTVRSAHRILVLQGGRIAEAGTHVELLACGGVYADLVLRQQAAALRVAGEEDAGAAVQLST
jgi:ATP-binding cassette subfamily B protein/subfamily B ATP-binding cassette protein MsbA